MHPESSSDSLWTSAGTSPANLCCFYMARGPQSLRGNVNAALNGLVHGGVITAFETNFDSISGLGVLHIAVTADLITDPRIPGYERPKVMAIRNRVAKELEAVGATDVIVSVRSALK